MFRRRRVTSPRSKSAKTIPGRSSVVASTSANGPTAVLCPQAWYPSPVVFLAGEHVRTKH